MMGRLEKKYNFIMDILAWCHGKYTKEQLEKMTMTELFEIHNNCYWDRMGEINRICK